MLRHDEHLQLQPAPLPNNSLNDVSQEFIHRDVGLGGLQWYVCAVWCSPAFI
jgi:hypothetical protein